MVKERGHLQSSNTQSNDDVPAGNFHETSPLAIYFANLHSWKRFAVSSNLVKYHNQMRARTHHTRSSLTSNKNFAEQVTSIIDVSVVPLHWHVQNATIPCPSQGLLPFLLYTFSCHIFSTNFFSILSHLILLSISSWSTSQSCSQIHM